MQQREIQVGGLYACIGYTADPEQSYIMRLRSQRDEPIDQVTVIAKNVPVQHPATARRTKGVEVRFADGRSEAVLAQTVMRTWDEHLSEREYWRAVANRNARQRAAVEQQLTDWIAPYTQRLAAAGVQASARVSVRSTDAVGAEQFASRVTLSGLPLTQTDGTWPDGTVWVADRMMSVVDATATTTVDVGTLESWVQRCEADAAAVSAHRDAGIAWYDQIRPFDPEAIANAAATFTDAGLSAVFSASNAPIQWLLLAEQHGNALDVDALVRLRALQLLLTCGVPARYRPVADLRQRSWQFVAEVVPDSELRINTFSCTVSGFSTAHLTRLPAVAADAQAVEERIRALLTGARAL